MSDSSPLALITITARAMVVHLFEDLPSVDERESDVEQDDVDGGAAAQHLRRGDPVGRKRRLVAGRVERSSKDLAERCVVLDDEDVRVAFVGQQDPGPAVAPVTTVIVSVNVAGGLNAW